LRKKKEKKKEREKVLTNKVLFGHSLNERERERERERGAFAKPF
jgi:hypothetical protein